MNQEKIGKFIADVRKEKDMTQVQLANRLGVTDRAISKWENGRGMPDWTLIKPLCKELGITMNELLSGEKIKKEDYQERFEENVLNTISYTENKINKFKKITKIILSGAFVILILFFTLFCIDVKRMYDNKPVLFSTWGYDYAPPIDLSEEKVKIAIETYLIDKADSEMKHHDTEKSFASFRTYLMEEKEDKSYYNVYAWVLEETYYLENDEVMKDSGSSIPYKFVVEVIDNEYVVTDSKIPRDGSFYVNDMKNIFPKSVRKNMDNIHKDGTIDRLQLEIQKQVNLYFHK